MPAPTPPSTPAPQSWVEVDEDQPAKAGGGTPAPAPPYRLRRFVVTTAVYVFIWLLTIAFVHTDTGPSFYLALLLPFYLLTLLLVLKGRRGAAERARHPAQWYNRLALTVLIFLLLYIPFTFFSDRIIPYAPILEFFLFALSLFLLLRLVGRSVGVAASHTSLPPPHHRLHQQVVSALDDTFYQQTLFLNFDFVDKGRGGRQLAKRLETALESYGVGRDRRAGILEDLRDYREGFRLGFSFTSRGRERRRLKRDGRRQLLRRTYTKFSRELEQIA